MRDGKHMTTMQKGGGPFGRRFPIFLFELWRKNNEASNFLNAVEREPVETRALNPTASEASYKPKQRSYRKTKQHFFFFNFWNLHGRLEIGSLERRTNFQIFLFRVMVILVSFFWKKSPRFLITREKKSENFFYIFPVLFRTLRTIHNHFIEVILFWSC